MVRGLGLCWGWTGLGAGVGVWFDSYLVQRSHLEFIRLSLGLAGWAQAGWGTERSSDVGLVQVRSDLLRHRFDQTCLGG